MSTQVVLITGALTGIGRAAAVAFAKKGAKVVVSGRRDEAGAALAKELRDSGAARQHQGASVRLVRRGTDGGLKPWSTPEALQR
jgi:NAD(P)-dependent dehydrogenase (short-subunit alcohol dehydrogenase family)